jgi:predicted enzyme related to lactoylglutathione lyase
MRPASVFLLAILFIIVSGDITQAQDLTSPADWRLGASAIVVKNVDTSEPWYQAVFKLTVKSRMDDPNGAYKVVILEAPNLMLELIQLKGSVTREEVFAGKPPGTQLQGHFKIGFKVRDIDACLAHLKTVNVNVPKVWEDKSTKKRNFLISDPDGNYIQFFD